MEDLDPKRLLYINQDLIRLCRGMHEQYMRFFRAFLEAHDRGDEKTIAILWGILEKKEEWGETAFKEEPKAKSPCPVLRLIRREAKHHAKKKSKNTPPKERP
jgi:hypothetical protein